MSLGKQFDHKTICSFTILLILSLLGISILSAIQETEALQDPYRTNTIEKRIMILEGATLIDGTASPPKPNSVIVINGDKIVNISDTGKYFNQDKNLAYPYNTTKRVVLNLTGKYVIPGLFDMHAHVAGVLKNSYNKTKSENFLKMLLINGVTTIRNPGGPTAESVWLREMVAAGQLLGPKIFTAGRLINDPQIPIPFVEKQVNTEQEVREEVRRQASEGVDYIKLYVGLGPNLVRAAINEAHALGLKVIGHLYLTSWTEAANLGIDALTHGVPVSPFLLTEDKQRTFYESGGDPFNHFLWLSLVGLNSTKIKEIINTLAKHNIPVDPTLDIYEAMLKDDIKHKYLWSKVLRLTKMMYDGGVKILSGTDIPNFGLIPGQSLHHELELLQEAGIAPSDVIKIATVNGAQALGILDQVGTIQAGKEPNMIILKSNPIVNVSNIKKIEAVINEGKFVS